MLNIIIVLQFKNKMYLVINIILTLNVYFYRVYRILLISFL